MLALSAYILERSSLLLDIAHFLCQLDCLLSLATVARENNWCKPEIVEQGKTVIRGCVSMGSMGSAEPMEFWKRVPEPMDFEQL